MIARAIEEKRNLEMKECSFKPKISTARSPSPKGALPPGYQETIARIRSAKVQKEEQQKLLKEVGQPKLSKNSKTKDGSTIVKPFNFQTE